MNGEHPIVIQPAPVVEHLVAQEPAAPAVLHPAPTLEQEHRADQAFENARQQEAHLISGLLGLQAGSLLLHDLAKEHLSPPPEGEEERRTRLRPLGQPLPPE